MATGGSPYFTQPKEPLSATQGLGPHHAPPVDEHVHLIPGFKPKATVRRPPTVTKAPAAPKGFNAIVAYKKHQVEQMKAHLAAQHGEAFTKLPKWAQEQTARKALKPGPSGDQKSQLNSAELATTSRMKYQNEGGLPGAILRDTVTSLVPKTLVDIAQGNPVHGGQVVSDIGNTALNFLPVGKAAGILGGLRGLKKVKDVEETAKAAHATEEAAKVREVLPGMKIAQGKQKAAQSLERKARVLKAQEHLNNTDLGPDQRIALAKNELKGELPKLNYKGLTELDENAVKTMKTDVLNHPHLLPFQKIRAAGALDKAHNGETLQKNEIDLLQHIFGKQPGLGHATPSALKNGVLSALNIPRSLMASVDLSAPFRQGLVVSTRHPAIFAKNFKPMVKAFGNEKVYRATLDEIKSRPSYPMMQAAKLNITDLGHAVGDREEQFASDMAEKLTGGKMSPVRASGRAYTGFLDKTRADVFDHLIQRAQTQGVNIQDEKFLKDLGRYVNSATGRGPLGPLQGAAKGLNALFFSPRLLASRVDMIFSPLTYAKADPFVRKEALRSMFQLAGTASTLVALASQIPGVKVVSDPRNPDWGKMKVGNTRIDIGGGFQQPLRLFAQVATGTAISSTTGKKLNLTANGFGQPTRLDLVTRFFEGKESPWASVATDYLRNSDQVGHKFSWGNEAYSHLTPLLVQDVSDLYHDRKGGVDGIAAAFGGAAIGSVGFGLQTYGPQKPKAKSVKPVNPFSGNSSPYFSGGSSSGGSPYFSAP